MSNFYYNDVYMKSTSYYDGENSWEGQRFENPLYSMPYHHECFENPLYMSFHHDDALQMNFMENSWEGQCFKEPQYDMSDHFEELNFVEVTLRTIFEETESLNSRLDGLEQRMIASSQRMLALRISNMYGDEEFMEENVEMEVQQVQPFKDQVHDKFVDLYNDPFLEQPCAGEKTKLKEYIGNWTFEHNNEKLEQSVFIKLVASVEDPFFITLPEDKFRSFEPYISRSIVRSSHDPLTSKAIICMKRSNLQGKVHCRLDGRKIKWDLKVD